MAARSPFDSPLLPPDPIEAALARRRAQQHQQQVYLSRQRLLVAKGYITAVDGRWGPISRQAWLRYRKGLPPITAGADMAPQRFPAPAGGLARRANERIPDSVLMGEAAASAANKARDDAFHRNQRLKAKAVTAQARATTQKAKAMAPGLQAAGKVIGRNTMLAQDPALGKIPLAIKQPKTAIKKIRTSQAMKDTQKMNDLAVAGMEAARDLPANLALKRIEIVHEIRGLRKKEPSKWTPHEFALIYASPYGVQNWATKPVEIKKVQQFLNSRGAMARYEVGVQPQTKSMVYGERAKLKVTGKMDKQTVQAYMREIYHQRAVQHTKNVRMFIRLLYDPLHLRPGEGRVPGTPDKTQSDPWSEPDRDLSFASDLPESSGQPAGEGHDPNPRSYNPGYRPGEPGFPILGVTPTPEELTKIFEHGGFVASAIMRALGKELKEANPGFLAIRDKNVEEALRGVWQYANAKEGTRAFFRSPQASAQGVFAPPKFVESKSVPVQAMQAISSFMVRGADPSDMVKGDTYMEELAAIAHSTTEAGMLRAVDQIRATDERNWLEYQAQRAKDENDTSFWKSVASVAGPVLEAIGEPAVQTATFVHAYVFHAGRMAEAAKRGIEDAGRTGLWHQQQTGQTNNFAQIPGISPQAAQYLINVGNPIAEEAGVLMALTEEWQRQHRWLFLGEQILLDPLNWLPGKWVALPFRAGKGLFVHADQLGVKLVEAEAAGAGVGAFVTGKALSTPAAAGRITTQALSTSTSWIGGTRAVKPVVTWGSAATTKLTRTKAQVISHVNDKVRNFADNGFKRPANLADQALDPEDLKRLESEYDLMEKSLSGHTVTNPVTGEKIDVQAEADLSAARHSAKTGEQIRGLLRMYADNFTGLYATVHRGRALSVAGHQLVAMIHSYVRGMHVQNLADEAFAKSYKEHLKESWDLYNGGLKPSDVTTRNLKQFEDADEGLRTQGLHQMRVREKRPQVGAPVERALSRDEIEKLFRDAAATYAQRNYRDVLEAAGSYLYGGASYEMMVKLDELVAETMNGFYTAILPTMQDIIEETVEKRGLKSMYNEKGVFVARNSKLTRQLREVARSTFDEVDAEFGKTVDDLLKSGPIADRLLKKQRAIVAKRDKDIVKAEKEVVRLAKVVEDAKPTHGDKVAVLLYRDRPGLVIVGRPGESPKMLLARRIQEDIERGAHDPMAPSPYLHAKAEIQADFNVDPQTGEVLTSHRTSGGKPLVGDFTMGGQIIEPGQLAGLSPESQQALKGTFIGGRATEAERKLLRDSAYSHRVRALQDLTDPDTGYKYVPDLSDEFFEEFDEAGNLVRQGRRPNPKQRAIQAFERSISPVRRGRGMAAKKGRVPQPAKAVVDDRGAQMSIKDAKTLARQAIYGEGYLSNDAKLAIRSLLPAGKKGDAEFVLILKHRDEIKAKYLRGKAKKETFRKIQLQVSGYERDLAQAAEEIDLIRVRAKVEIQEAHDVALAQATKKADLRDRSTIEIRNMNFGKKFTPDEKSRYIAAQMMQKERSVRGWAVTDNFRGMERTEEQIQRILGEWASRLNHQWEQVGDHWEMKNEFIRAPAIYARQLDAIWGEAIRGNHPLLTADDVPPKVKEILNVAAPPGSAAGSKVAMDVERLSAMMTGRTYRAKKVFGSDIDPTKAVTAGSVSFQRPHEAALGISGRTKLGHEVVHSYNLQTIIGEGRVPAGGTASPGPLESWAAMYNKHLGIKQLQADRVTPYLYRREWAIFRALSTAQSMPLRALYLTSYHLLDAFSTAVIALSPKTVFRNVVDNMIRTLIRGHLDPRAWFYHLPEKAPDGTPYRKFSPSLVFKTGGNYAVDLHEMRITRAIANATMEKYQRFQVVPGDVTDIVKTMTEDEWVAFKQKVMDAAGEDWPAVRRQMQREVTQRTHAARVTEAERGGSGLAREPGLEEAPSPSISGEEAAAGAKVPAPDKTTKGIVDRIPEGGFTGMGPTPLEAKHNPKLRVAWGVMDTSPVETIVPGSSQAANKWHFGQPGESLDDLMTRKEVVGTRDTAVFQVSFDEGTGKVSGIRYQHKPGDERPVSQMLETQIKAAYDGVAPPPAAAAKVDQTERRDAFKTWLHGNEEDTMMLSVFSLGIRQLKAYLRYQVAFVPGGWRMLDEIDRLTSSFWAAEGEKIRNVFQAHGVDVPREAVMGHQMLGDLRQMTGPGDRSMMRTPKVRMTNNVWASMAGLSGKEAEEYILTYLPTRPGSSMATFLSYSRDALWEVMVGTPEGTARARLYRNAYSKAQRKGKDNWQAHIHAMKEIEHTLFDYDQVTVLEDNLRIFAPFLFYWRKTIPFWMGEMVRKPWIPSDVDKLEDNIQAEGQDAGRPPWMRRYLEMNWATDIAAKVPVVNWIFPGMDDMKVGADPMGFWSGSIPFRAFKNENPSLPEDEQGWKFIADILDGINGSGLSFTPFLRKPLEWGGIANYRAWQSALPQTNLVQAFTREYMHDAFPDGLNVENIISDKLFDLVGSDLRAKKFDDQRYAEMVQLYMATQAAEGLVITRADAEKMISTFVWMQTAFGFFSSMYVRNISAPLVRLYQIADGLHHGTLDYMDLNTTEQAAYQMFKRRKWDPVAFNQYLDTVPKIEAYYAIENFNAKQKYAETHPEIIPYVTPSMNGGKLLPAKKLHLTVRHMVDTESHFQIQKIIEDSGGTLNREQRQMINHLFVTPELMKWWAANDTRSEVKQQMEKAAVYHYLATQRELYFAIPFSDKKAQSQFLKENPLVAHDFLTSNTVSDDLEDPFKAAQADLRNVYFERVDKDDWNGAAALLKEHPWIFKFTKSQRFVSDDGIWLPAGKNTERGRAYLKAYPALQHYFKLIGNGTDKEKEKAYDWLDGHTPGAALVREYFARYLDNGSGTKAEHARAYRAMKPLLVWFFDTLKDNVAFRGYEDKWEWMQESEDPAAKKIRTYLRKYGKAGGSTAHARDYLKAKTELHFYFDLSKKDPAAAKEWLHSGSAEAETVRAYFKKYGKMASLSRKWSKWVRSENPEIDRRMLFWHRYFGMPPDERPAFVHAHAEDYGVFVYGPIGSHERHQEESDYLRKAKKKHLSAKTALYLRIQPLLDVYFTLTDPLEKRLMERANPDMKEWLTKYSDGVMSGDKKLDKQIEAYFKFQPDSAERADFLRSHPEVQQWFDMKNPADAAIHRILEVYFSIEDPKKKKDFLLFHQEINDYFDRKKMEKNNLADQTLPFDEADPRLEDYRLRMQSDIIDPAQILYGALRDRVAANIAGDEIITPRSGLDPKEQKRRRRKQGVVLGP